jgi:hypothetical protein
LGEKHENGVEIKGRNVKYKGRKRKEKIGVIGKIRGKRQKEHDKSQKRRAA